MPARPQHAAELGQRAVEVGQVVQDRVAEDQVEALVVERQALGVGGLRLHLEPEPLGVADSSASIPGEMSVATSRSISPAAAG